jgi:hypothetical protein
MTIEKNLSISNIGTLSVKGAVFANNLLAAQQQSAPLTEKQLQTLLQKRLPLLLELYATAKLPDDLYQRHMLADQKGEEVEEQIHANMRAVILEMLNQQSNNDPAVNLTVNQALGYFKVHKEEFWETISKRKDLLAKSFRGQIFTEGRFHSLLSLLFKLDSVNPNAVVLEDLKLD